MLFYNRPRTQERLREQYGPSIVQKMPPLLPVHYAQNNVSSCATPQNFCRITGSAS